MKCENGLKNVLKHPLFTAVVSGVAGAVAGSFFTYNVTIHDAVTYNNISSYIGNLLVTPQLVDKEILEKDTPFEQIEVIANTMNTQKAEYNDIMNEKEELDKIIKQIENQKVAELYSPDMNILGVTKDTTLKNYLASIDGCIYYSEDFLNTFLQNKISYNNDIIQYGKDLSKKTDVSAEGLLYDNNEGIDIYNGDTFFEMGKNRYFYGIVAKGYTGGKVNIACDGNYSKISFVLGHINDTGISDLTLRISYLDSDNIFKEERSIELNDKIPIQTVEIPIYNTKILQITTELNNGAQDGHYGLAEIYLIK